MLSIGIENDETGPLSAAEKRNANLIFALYIAVKIAAIVYLFAL